MFELALVYYLVEYLDRLDTIIKIVIGILLVATIIFIIVAIISHIDGYADTNRIAKAWTKRLGIPTIILTFLWSFMPSKNTLVVLVGAYYADQLIETKVFNEYSNKVKLILDSKLDEMLNETNKVSEQINKTK